MRVCLLQEKQALTEYKSILKRLLKLFFTSLYLSAHNILALF